MTIDVSKLTFPQVSPEGIQALDIINQPEPDVGQLQSILLKDPVLAGIIIKQANSPLYRRANEISNVPAAIRVLGFKSLRSAVVMATLQGSSALTPTTQAIWEHSTATALAARTLAEKIHPEVAEDMEFIGLIHDVGMLVLANNFPDEYQDLLLRSNTEQSPIDQLEINLFGTHHGAIIRHIQDQFRLPTATVEILAKFHTDTSANHIQDNNLRLLYILELSHFMLGMIDQQHLAPFIETIAEPMTQLQTSLGIDNQLLEQLKAKIEERLADQ